MLLKIKKPDLENNKWIEKQIKLTPINDFGQKLRTEYSFLLNNEEMDKIKDENTYIIEEDGLYRFFTYGAIYCAKLNNNLLTNLFGFIPPLEDFRNQGFYCSKYLIKGEKIVCIATGCTIVNMIQEV